MRLARCIGMLCVVFVVIACSTARAVECSREDADTAERSVDHLRSWQTIYSAYKRFKQCDDGGIAEGYSDAVAKIMANHWSSLPRVLPLVHADPAFETWFVQHLNETDDFDDLIKIDRLARTACPPGTRELCMKIHDQMRSYNCDPKYPESVGCKVRNLKVQ